MNNHIYLLQIIAFLDLLAVGMILPLLSSHVHTLGGNLLCVGLLGSIYAGFQLGSGPLIGSLSDLKGRKTILTMTLLVCSLSYSLMGLTTSIIVVLIIRAILGVFKQTQTLTKALVADYERDEQKQSDIYGRLAAVSGVGITVGPIVSGHVLDDYPGNGFRWVSLAVGGCFLLNAGLVTLLPKAKNVAKKDIHHDKIFSISLFQTICNSLHQSVKDLCRIKWSMYGDIFMYKALVGFAMGIYYSNYPTYLKSQFSLSPKNVGYIIAFQGVVGTVSSYFMGFINTFYTQDDKYNLRNFHVFLMLCISIVGLMSSNNAYFYTVWLLPLAVGNAISRLITLEMLLKRSKGNDRGKLIGAASSVRSLTGIASPMVAGFIGQFVGIEYVIHASLVSTVLGLILSYQNLKKVKHD